MTRGIVALLGLAATLVLAGPVALLGVEFLLGDRPLTGAGLLAVAVLIVAIGEYVPTHDDVVGSLAERVTGRVVETDDEE